MRPSCLSLFAAAALSVGLSACAAHAPLVPPSEVSYVDRVHVRLAPGVASPRIAEEVKSTTRREATRYGRSGAAKELRISVEQVHYKNPVASLLIGDANHIRAQVAVVDTASGREHGSFEANAIDNLAINGVVGAVMAATQDPAVIDRRLAEGLASNVMERVYGTAAATEARKRPTVEIVESAEPAAPAPAAAPKAPANTGPEKRAPAKKQVPVAARKGDRTAMATVPAPAAR